MDFSIKRGPINTQKTACLVLGVNTGKSLSDIATTVDKRTRGAISRIVKRGDISGKPGSSLLLPDVAGISADRVLLIGIGKPGALTAADYLKVVRTCGQSLNSHGIKNAISTLLDVDIGQRDLAWRMQAHAEAVAKPAYRFSEHKSKPAKAGLSRLSFWTGDDDQAAARSALVRARAAVNGIKLTRDLANRPGNVCTPSHLAESALGLAEQFSSLKTNVIEEAEMEEMGMGSLLSVSRGSRQPAKLITIEYAGGTDGEAPIVLVGKGVTFDSGGISIKPGPGMDEMKYDMCGAATVLGVMSAVAEMKAPINVVGIVPATENLPDGNASKPGDIVTSMSGQTIEILNTDAEGRLILCDALTYADRYSPGVVIDIATLTGACIVALGSHASGLMSNDDALADELLAAGERVGDRAWRLPLWDEYQTQIDSPFADMANVGGRPAGTVTAACFLSRFTKDYRWAHLDIAGTAWTSGKNKSASGRPVGLLLEYINSQIG